jgi:hypothetical protein
VATAKSRRVYQLKVTLRGVRPPVWRRIQVWGDTYLSELHVVLQTAMGWANYHLHEFTIAKRNYGEILPDLGRRDDRLDESKFRLDQLARRSGAKFTYTYDFGDNWIHAVVVESIAAPEAGAFYPRCTAGRGACPPEDCGGPYGFVGFLEAIADPSHPHHKAVLEWNGPFDPAAFSPDGANRAFQKVFGRRRAG